MRINQNKYLSLQCDKELKREAHVKLIIIMKNLMERINNLLGTTSVSIENLDDLKYEMTKAGIFFDSLVGLRNEEFDNKFFEETYSMLDRSQFTFFDKVYDNHEEDVVKSRIAYAEIGGYKFVFTAEFYQNGEEDIEFCVLKKANVNIDINIDLEKVNISTLQLASICNDTRIYRYNYSSKKMVSYNNMQVTDLRKILLSEDVYKVKSEIEGYEGYRAVSIYTDLTFYLKNRN